MKNVGSWYIAWWKHGINEQKDFERLVSFRNGVKSSNCWRLFFFSVFGLTLIAFDNKDLIKKQKRCIKHIHLKTDGGFVSPKKFLQNENLFLFTFQKMVLK